MAKASDVALSMNIVMNSAIKGANFLQASTKGIYKYSSQVQRINLLRATKFGTLNKNIKTLDNHLTKISTKASYISKHPIKLDVNRDKLMEARKDLTAMARDSQTIYNYSKLTNQKLQEGARLASKAQKKRLNVTAGDVMGKVMVATAFALPFKASIDFESEMARVKALANASPLQFKAMVSKAKELGATTEWKATEVAQGMQFLSMAGFKPEQTVKAMKGVLSLATVGQLDLATTSDIASNILSSFSLKAEDMTRVSDIMAKTITTANVDVQMLGDTMKYAAPAASSLGASIEEVSTLAAKMGDVGIQGSMAGTAIRSMYVRLSAPPTEAKKALDALGISAFDSNGKFKGMITIIGELNQAMKGMSQDQKSAYLKKIFGVEALSGAMAVLKVGKKELLKYQESLKNSAGTADKIQRIQLSTTAGQFKLLGSAIEGLTISATAGLLPVIRSVTSGITTLTTWITKATDKYPTLTSLVLGAGVAFVTAGVALATFGFMATMAGNGLRTLGLLSTAGKVGILSRAFSLAGGAIRFMGSSLLFIGRALLLNPIGLAVTAIAGGAYLIYSNWSRIKGFFSSLWSGVKGIFSTTWSGIKTLLSWSPLGLVVTNWSKIKGFFGYLVSAIKYPFVTFFNWIKSKFEWIFSLVGKVKGFVTGAVDKAKNLASNAWQKTKDTASNAWSGVKNFFGFGDDKEKKEASKVELKTSLKPANNTEYKPLTNPTKKSVLAPVTNSQTLNEPSYYTPKTTFNDVNTKAEQSFNSYSGSSKNVNVSINGIHIQVQTTDGKFNHDEFVEQVEEALKEIEWDKTNLSHKDVA